MSNKEQLGHFKVLRQIGSGSFGYVLECQDGNLVVAVKVPKRSMGDQAVAALQEEYATYQRLHYPAPLRNFPTMRLYQQPKTFAAMDLLGPNLETVRLGLPGQRFNLQQTLLITVRMIELLKTMHNKGIVHRDIKPDNFALGLHGDARRLFCLDFGLATHLSAPSKLTSSFLGTTRYASMAAHHGRPQAFRDDLEACVYTIVYLFRGKLPWQRGIGGHERLTNSNRNETVLSHKQKIESIKLCEFLPTEYAELHKYTRSLNHYDIPCYDDWIMVFKYIYMRRNYDRQYLFEELVYDADNAPTSADSAVSSQRPMASPNI